MVSFSKRSWLPLWGDLCGAVQQNKQHFFDLQSPSTGHGRVQEDVFKPRAIKAIREFAVKHMETPDVRIDTRLNKFMWSNGVRNIPRRVRVKLSRKRNEDEDSVHKLYTLVTHVDCADFKGKGTVNVDSDE